MNQLIVNWDKTKIMIISKSNKHLDNKRFLSVNDNKVEIVKSFKLLGVIIDDSLKFNDNISNTKKTINKKIFTLKKMKYLNLSTKIQFYKSFILPHFDYCLGLCVFYTKQQIDNLERIF